jgi:hypothetical protein
MAEDRRCIGEPRALMLTITGPGVDGGLPWDEEACWHLGPHTHSGKLGCKVAAPAASAWNEKAPGWWTDLHNAAAQGAARRVGVRPKLLVRPWELQKRGVLHAHPILGYSTRDERLAADVYLEELGRLAEAHGFGYVSQRPEQLHPRAAAAYVSSYFVAGKKGKMTLRESVTSRAMPPSIIYVRPELSQRSGITMRTLRLRRYAWQLWRCEVEPRGLDEVAVGDIWQGLQAGKTLAAIVSSCLDRD